VAARGGKGAPVVVLAGGAEIRLGSADSLGLKLDAAALVLDALTGDERAELAYVDVSVPERAVAGAKSQPKG
jgi:hypothetical protein